MQPSLLAIRSIAAEFAHRLFIPVAAIIMIISVLLLGLTVWLTTISVWWWILFVLFLFVILVATALLVIVGVLIRAVAPARTKDQKQQTKAFVDKLQRVSEVAATPKFVLLFQAIWDMVRPREKGYIASISHDTASLARDFTTLIQAFKK